MFKRSDRFLDSVARSIASIVALPRPRLVRPFASAPRGPASCGQRRVGGRAQDSEQVERLLGQRAAPRVDYVEIAPQRLGVGDLDGHQFSLPELLRKRDLRKKTETELALNHSFRGFNRFPL